MTLLDRMTCRVQGCQRHRAPDALVCSDHLTAMWRNQLDRQPDGTYTARRVFPVRDMTGALRAA